MKYVIEDNVPVPNAFGRTGFNAALCQMQPGQSTRIDGLEQTRAQSAIQYAQRKTGFKFVTRKEEGGVRIWRTA